LWLILCKYEENIEERKEAIVSPVVLEGRLYKQSNEEEEGNLERNELNDVLNGEEEIILSLLSLIFLKLIILNNLLFLLSESEEELSECRLTLL
jgi:hypothetical protein